MARRRRAFGKIRRLPSGRYQASYIGPDSRRHNAPLTFEARVHAERWLSAAETDIARHEWRRPGRPARTPTLATYAASWLATRRTRSGQLLRPRTRVEYQRLLDGCILPSFGTQHLDEITSAAVRAWHAELDTGPTHRARAYGLLHAILATAVADEAITANPCRVRGGGQVDRASQTRPATLVELATIAETMRPAYRAAVLLSAWCGLRFGEVAELRRADIDLARAELHVRRAVVYVDGKPVVGEPKSRAGVRTVAIPPHLLPVLAAHLREHAPMPNALLFPSPGGLALRSDGALHRDFRAAARTAGRPDLRFHDLRHTGATLAAATGATLAELMARLGHSTPGAAMRYQHAAAERDKVIAEALSRLAGAVVEIGATTG